MNIEIRNSSKELLDYAFHGDYSDTSMLVIIGHGVTGNKDRPWAIGLAEALEEAGINALRFSFSGNGESEGKFEDCTISKEVRDLKTIINVADDEGFHKVCYIGHSMGAAVGVISATKDDRISQLVSLGGMVHTKKFCEVEFGDQKPDKGFMWDEKECPLSQAFVDDMDKIGNVLSKTEKIEVPWLLVHGDADDVVPVEESREIFAAAYQPKELRVVPGSDHVFSGDSLQKMIDVVVPWVKQHYQ